VPGEEVLVHVVVAVLVLVLVFVFVGVWHGWTPHVFVLE
jgi:hypothetical protein